MTKQEIIEETVQYYQNNPFGVNESKTQCTYYGSKGEMCAVGRCMIDAELWKDKDSSLESILDKERSLVFDSLLKEEYRGHDIEFWQDLQSFHDNSAFVGGIKDPKTFWSTSKYYGGE